MIVSDTVIECISTHLTSFAVLVDHQGLLDQDTVYYYTLLNIYNNNIIKDK